MVNNIDQFDTSGSRNKKKRSNLALEILNTDFDLRPSTKADDE